MNCLDYAALRRSIPISQVLSLIDFRPSHQRYDQLRGACPFCAEDARADSRCFSVNLRRNLFHCFRCTRSGNSLDLWMEYSGLELHSAALELCRRL